MLACASHPEKRGSRVLSEMFVDAYICERLHTFIFCRSQHFKQHPARSHLLATSTIFFQETGDDARLHRPGSAAAVRGRAIIVRV